jgi:hypothetical protein
MAAEEVEELHNAGNMQLFRHQQVPMAAMVVPVVPPP